jgi:anti-anti-sigma factor
MSRADDDVDSTPEAGAPAYVVDAQPRAGRCVVLTPRGELDLSNAAVLRESFDRVALVDDVIVDVSGVPFLDSVALGVLAGAALKHRDHGSYVVLSGARPFLRKLLALTRLGGLLPDGGTEDEARALLHSYRREVSVEGGHQAVRATATG